MADFNLETFVDEVQYLAGIRNLDPYNPIVLHIEQPASNSEFRVVGAIREPSRYIVPVNGIWVVLDPDSSYYRKVLRLVDPNVEVAPFNATWEEVFSRDEIFNHAQHFDVLQGKPGVQGPPGKDSLIPGPAGPQGVPGNPAGIVVATGVVLTSSSLIFKVAKDGTSGPTSITFLARVENLDGVPTFAIVSGAGTLTVNGNVATLRYADMTTDIVTVRASVTDDEGHVYTDDETVAKVREGSDGITMILTNETVTLASAVDGTVGDYTTAKTDVIIYQGANDVTAQWPLSKVDSNGVVSTLVGKTVSITGLTVDEGSVEITAVKSGQSPIRRTFTATRVRQGEPGVGAFALVLTPDSQIFPVDENGLSSISSITFTALLKNITGTPVFSITDGTGVLLSSGNTTILSFDSMETETVTVSAVLVVDNITYHDETTVAKIHSGSSGITALLTNESVTLTCDTDGTVLSVAGAETTMVVYQGATETTNAWTYSRADSVGLTTNIVGNKVSVAGLTSDSGYADVTASQTGFPDVTKRFSVSKAKGGRDGSGANAFNVVLTVDSQIFAINKDGVAAPTQVVFSALLQNITGTPVFTVSTGSGVLDVTGNTAVLQYGTMASDTLTVKVTVTDIVTSIIYTDETTVVKLREGTDAVNSILTNETVNLTADSDGDIASFSGADTLMKVFVGATDSTAQWTFSKVDSSGLTTTLSANHVTVTALNVDNGYTDITAARSGFDSITKRFSVTRTKAAKDGEFKALVISANSHVFATNKQGQTSPAIITFTAKLNDLTGNPTFTVLTGDATLNSVGNVATLAFADMLSPSITVRASIVEGAVTYQDDITVAKLADGSDSVTVLLSNETVTLPADNMGVVQSFAGASTSVSVYVGIADTTNLWTATKVDSPGLTTTLSGKTVTVTALSEDSGYTDITVARQGFPSITKRFSITKGKAGSDGSSEGLTLNSDSQVFVVDSTGASSLSKITFQAVLNNITGTPVFEVVDGTAVVTGLNDIGTVEFASMTSETVTIRASVTYNGIIYDDLETIAKLHNGSDAITGLLTNENVTLPASSLGVVPSFASAVTKMNVYMGSADLTNQWTFTRVNSAGVTSALAANQVSVTAMTGDSGYVDITATGPSGTTVTKRMTIAKAKAGLDGNAQLIILNATSKIFAVDKASVAAPQQITLSATLQNIAGTPTYSILSGTGALLPAANNTVILAYSSMQSESITIRVSLTSGNFTYTDDETIVKVRAGTDSLTGVLTNETAGVPADVNGVVSSFTGVATSLLVYQGATDVTANYTVTKVDGAGVTSTLTNGVVQVTTMTVDNGFVDISARRTGAPMTESGLLKRFTVTKFKTGVPGVNGLSGLLTNEAFAFNADVSGNVSNYTGATTQIKILNGVVDDSANWTVTKADSAGITSTLVGKTVTVTAMSQSVDTGTVTVTAARNGFPSIQRVFSVSKSKAGTPGTPGTPGTSGVNGKRGSRTFYLTGYPIWNDSAATVAASVEGGPILNDTVVETNQPTSYSQTRFWTGSSWATVDQIIDGNLVVRGTIGTNQLAANSIKAGSAIIENGALGTLMIGGNAVTQVLSGLQKNDHTVGTQVPIRPNSVWTEVLRYQNAQFTGTQPILVWGSMNTVGIHTAEPVDVVPPNTAIEVYDGYTWYHNWQGCWYDVRVTMLNKVTGAQYHFICQAGVESLAGMTAPATINALFPVLPAGLYDVIVYGKVEAVPGIQIQGCGMRSGQIAILETKR